MTLLQEGQDIRGSYVVERLLGEGAFAEVYRVRHRFLGRQAMKVLKTPGMNAQEIEEMLSEAISVSHWTPKHCSSVRCRCGGRTGNETDGFFTMEYVAGGSLNQFWKSTVTNLFR